MKFIFQLKKPGKKKGTFDLTKVGWLPVRKGDLILSGHYNNKKYHMLSVCLSSFSDLGQPSPVNFGGFVTVC